MAENFDAVVIGGGPAGSVAALLLAQAGWSVVLLERKKFPRRKVCGEYVSLTNWPLLESIGIADSFRKIVGPEVRRVGLLSGTTCLSAELPLPDPLLDWGRALSRERLDTLLLKRASDVGVEVLHPWAALALTEDKEGYICHAISRETSEEMEIRAPIVIAAHGSWDPGPLPTQPARSSHRPSDLLGFKAHFRNCGLPEGLMPLLSFPGGYGGMVHCDEGRVSLSCCIRRDQLTHIRRSAGPSAGEAVLRHILQWCPVLRPILSGAAREGSWLSAGPIRPGIRPRYHRGIFAVGNAAGEAHPVVAEGISMAMQSAWLLAERLVGEKEKILSRRARDAVGRDYASAWHRSFAWRIHTASLFAHLAMRPAVVDLLLPLIRYLPEILGLGARLSGKAAMIVRPIPFPKRG